MNNGVLLCDNYSPFFSKKDEIVLFIKSSILFRTAHATVLGISYIAPGEVTSSLIK